MYRIHNNRVLTEKGSIPEVIFRGFERYGGGHVWAQTHCSSHDNKGGQKKLYHRHGEKTFGHHIYSASERRADASMIWKNNDIYGRWYGLADRQQIRRQEYKSC